MIILSILIICLIVWAVKKRKSRGSLVEEISRIDVLSLPQKTTLLKSYEIKPPGFALSRGEICYYAGPAKAYTEKNAVIGSVSRGHGNRYRLTKNLSLSSYSGTRRNVRGTVSETFGGNFYITNQKIMLLSSKHGFQIPYSRLLSMEPHKDGIRFFEKSGKCYTMLTKDVIEICKRFKLIEV